MLFFVSCFGTTNRRIAKDTLTQDLARPPTLASHAQRSHNCQGNSADNHELLSAPSHCHPVDMASALTLRPRPPHYRRQPTPGGRSSIPKSLADPQVGWGHVARHPPTTFPPMHHLSGTRDPLEPPTLKPHNSLNIHSNLRSAPSLRAGRAREAAAGCGKVAWQARTALRTFPSRGVSAPA